MICLSMSKPKPPVEMLGTHQLVGVEAPSLVAKKDAKRRSARAAVWLSNRLGSALRP